MKVFHPLNKYCIEIQKGLFFAWWIYRASERVFAYLILNTGA